MKSIIPRFNSQRMVMDYVKNFYGPSSRRHRRLCADGGTPAKELSQWKQKIIHSWSSVKIHRIDNEQTEIFAGESLPIRISADLNSLESTDVIVECLVGSEDEHQEFTTHSVHKLTPVSSNDNETLFQTDLQPTLPGLQYYKIRIYPYHQLLSHPFETGFMIWL